MSKPYDSLGRLERVELRDIWQNESGDFTPWLARPENIMLLGETLGLDLEVQTTEQNVGIFYADILCKETSSDTFVLIENQIERTDHSHLGQLLTYAAGLKTVTIVWIAARFTEEHRAALDWLNEVTDERIEFFGLEIEVWRIGPSGIAPKFNIVCKPNNWSRGVSRRAEAAEVTEAKIFQREYWTAFADFVSSRSTIIRPGKPLAKHWMHIALGKSGIHLSAIASLFDSEAESYGSHEVRAEVVFNDRNSKAYFEQVFVHKDKIERSFGEPLIWYNPENVRMSKIYCRKTTNLHNREDWLKQHEWLLKKLEALHNIFSPMVRELSCAETEAAEVEVG